ncbi:hypothetical protein J4E93_008037 [Alternaria ventricosa]|uniref:uncharacterized protein n=1 Tax=Alternaria ventricosa TaxID=1187951 RepID=UPI0020C58807|nr:uncharacterized protein J4E93_008037 [Alternaria ventricosa]KAI4641159.1 hypothetical protein J4E93_008037 [Alternaria ventricosa]
MADKSQVPPVAPVYGAAAQGEIVTIFIGPEKKRYNIHKDIICHHSEYFRAAFNGRWKESDEGVTLEDVEVDVFNLFVHWLYAEEIPPHWESLSEIVEPGLNLDDSAWDDYSTAMLLLKASVFGDRFLTPAFHRLAHNTFVNRFVVAPGDHSSMSYYMVIWIYDNLLTSSPLVDLAVELQCIVWNTENDDKEEKLLWPQLPHAFLLAVMTRYSELKEEKCSDIELKACDYHLHASEEEKKACKQKKQK